jgi:uncharacterized protein (TIGR03083 family)
MMSVEGVQASRALVSEYTGIVRTLTASEWELPSRCAGWSVKDLVAHTSSAFRGLVDPPPAGEPDPDMTAEHAMDLLVNERRPWSVDEVRAEFVDFGEPALAVLAAMQDEPLSSQEAAIHDLGSYPLAALADAFAFDLYCHLRVDLLAPEGPVERDVPPITDDVLRPGVGWMLLGWPQMCPQVNPLLDQPLGLRLEGPGGGEFTVTPGDPLPTVREGIRQPAAVVTSTAADFIVWGTKRSHWRDSVLIEGDRDYGASILDALNII